MTCDYRSSGEELFGTFTLGAVQFTFFPVAAMSCLIDQGKSQQDLNNIDLVQLKKKMLERIDLLRPEPFLRMDPYMIIEKDIRQKLLTPEGQMSLKYVIKHRS